MSKINGETALEYESSKLEASGGVPLYTLEFAFNHNGKAYLFTYTAPAGAKERFGPAFMASARTIDFVVSAARVGVAQARSSAPKRSASASTIAFRSRAASSSVERAVGRLVGDREGDRLAPGADLVAPVDVEDADLAKLVAGCLTRRRDEVADRDVLGDGDGDVLPDGGVGDDVPVGDRAAGGVEEASEVELERSPLAFELARVELAEDAGAGRRASCRGGGAGAARARTRARP